MIVSTTDLTVSRLIVVCHEVKKKQHACTSSDLYNHYCNSELFTWMAALKFANAVPKLPLTSIASFITASALLSRINNPKME